ncbi:MAG TPA: hypothetical protein VHU19_03425 [Pyrinomonadaceae bacterium]|jgi:hypothetical protein|nr:hypothetical protein [Pyrinomonadaceae bacterium]
MRDRNKLSALKATLTGALLLTLVAAAAAQTASTTYHATSRDPFTKYKPALKRAVPKKVLAPVPVPPIQARIDGYKAQKQAAMNMQQPAPKPTTALTLSELQVIGIFRTPRGYAAMVEATPISLSYVVYPGERFYDGMLVAIEETRLVFRRQTRWTDGHTEVAVETKPLRQANAVTDSLAAQRPTAEAGAGAGAPAAHAANKTDVNTLVEALKALAASAGEQQRQQQDATGDKGDGKP